MNMIAIPKTAPADLDLLRAKALAAVQSGAPLKAVLTDLVHASQAAAETEMLASVLLVSEDGRRLVEGAAPSLPEDYNAAIDGIEIGPAVGSCGTAAHYGEPVFVSDIKTDPLWTDFREAAAKAGVRACWSLPVKDGQGRVIATFANYYREPRHPRPQDYDAIRLVGELVREVIEEDRRRSRA